MVSEPWLLRMGNQVSTNLKNSLFLHHHHTTTTTSTTTNNNNNTSTRSNSKQKHNNNNNNNNNNNRGESIGILSFEVANVMSKLVHLHKSVSDDEISKLKNETIKSEGITKLVSSDESYLLGLAFAERIDDLNRIAEVVSRLGSKCTEPALLGFQHVFRDLTTGKILVHDLGFFMVKDMDSMIRKMERFVAATANLYAELEVLNDLERATNKFHLNHNQESRRAFEQKLSWQRQDVSHLKTLSLWNQTYDKVVELLARTVCTLYARISAVFASSDRSLVQGHSVASSTFSAAAPAGVKTPTTTTTTTRPSLKRERRPVSHLKDQFSLQKGQLDSIQQRHDLVYPCAPSPGRIFMECLSISSSTSRVDDDDEEVDYSKDHVLNGGMNKKKEHPIHLDCFLYSSQGKLQGASLNNASSCVAPKSRLAAHATPSTVGGSALALHYANVIIVIEKLLHYPHLVGDEARDDLYQMLPSSLRKSLRRSLKSHFKNFAIFDGALAHDCKENLHQILKWLAPLAHNMIRWQSERNFEQQQIVTRTNALLLQTLYFADREKTESAICDLLVGLNYICRYEHQQNALLDCASSFDFGDWMEWQLQCQASCFD